MNDNQKNCFAYDEALKLVEKQIAHFKSLNLPLKGKRVVEVGSGPVGRYTEFLMESGADVTSLDIRQENLDALRARFSELKTLQGDMNQECLSDIYDVVFSVGNLYHLSKPIEAIKHMAEHCKDALFISTAVINTHTGIDFVEECKVDLAQAFDGVGCRPSREWLYKELKKYFKYVLVPFTQPDYEDFVTNWTPGLRYSHALRAIFMATNNKKLIDPSVWSEELLVQQTKYTC